MHELGIIVHVMRTVEEVAAENNLTAVSYTHLTLPTKLEV